MKIFIRNLVLCALPLMFAMGAGYGFTRIQGSCGAMVGALFAAKCAGRGLAAQDTTKAAAAPAQPAAASVSVDEAAVAKNVVDRVAQDTGSVFPVDVGQLVLWTKVSGAGGIAIHHVWFHGDTQVGDVELQVGGSPRRTWSRKSVPAAWTGPWHVEVGAAAGAVGKGVDS